jgi:menaquinone-dependent protoporphyrinogen oxidase
MPRILVAFGTTDGHTARIAADMAETLRVKGYEVDVHGGGTLTERVRPDDYDGVIVAASIHMGTYQRPVRRWVRRHHEALNRRPGAFLSVCLAVLEKDPKAQTEVRRIMDEFLAGSGWRPTIAKLVAGALPYTQYGWLKRLVMRRIVRKAGGDTDTTRDYEYTDWEDVRATALAVARLAAVGPAVAGLAQSPVSVG